MAAIVALEGNAVQARARHAEQLARQPSLAAAAAVLRDRADDDTSRALASVVERAAAPLARYRCAACGFEAQRHFWQCPGCMSWDSFPPQRNRGSIARASAPSLMYCSGARETH
jgi:lipopolysaccharide assembly protein B